MVPIFKGKDDIRNCCCHRTVKIIEHCLKVVERVLEKRHRRVMTVDEMQFGIMPERVTMDAVLILRRMQEEYHAKVKKLCICNADLEKAYD